MTTKELLAWWKEIPSKQKTYARLKPAGAVASELSFRKGDTAATIESFQRDRVRLSSRYPEFWRGLQLQLAELQAELDGAEVARIADDLEVGAL